MYTYVLSITEQKIKISLADIWSTLPKSWLFKNQTVEHGNALWQYE